MNTREELIGLRNELYDFSRRNPFVHVNTNQLWFVKQGANIDRPYRVAEKLYKKANFYLNEYGLETSLQILTFLKWLPPNENGGGDFITSPLFYYPCSIKRIRKIETVFVPELKDEVVVVNPIIRHYLRAFYQFELPATFPSLDLGIKALTTFFNEDGSEELNLVPTFNEIEQWQLITEKAIGNFNYKKSTLSADYEVIIEAPNNQIDKLFSGDSDRAMKEGDLMPNFIVGLDESQKKVVKKALNFNTVIQGPPGTGKSHTIVALIGAFLSEKKKVLFVSEKRSALTVVHQRLVEKDLGNLIAFFNTNKDQKKAFYGDLKETWIRFNQRKSLAEGRDSNKEISELLAYYPHKMNAFDTVLKSDLNGLIEVILRSGQSQDQLVATGRIPSFAVWQEHEATLVALEKGLLQGFNEKSIGECSFIQLSGTVFLEKEPILLLEKRFNDLTITLKAITKLQTNFQLEESFDGFVRLALTASILNMIDKVQIDLLNTESKKYKSFNTWAKKYQLLKVRLKQAELANQKWTRKPSISEITELLDLINVAERPKKGSIMRMLKRNPTKLKTAFSDFHPGISGHTKIKLLETVRLEWRLIGELEEVKIKLKHNLNIADPGNEIDLIFSLRNKLDAVSQSDYLKILEHHKTEELIKALSEIHPLIVRFNSQKRFLFQEYAMDDLTDFAGELEQLKAELSVIKRWLPEVKRFFKLPGDIRNFLLLNKTTVTELKTIVAYQNLLQETRFDSVFKTLSGWELLNEVQSLERERLLNERNNAEAILKDVYDTQYVSEDLLSTASFKLKEPLREAKKAYKKEKRLLLHEMNKQQRHLSVKSFFEETQEHLLKLQPVWMMNPLTVSENLPCIKDVFDVVIFDESSQIPLEDAIPSIFRAKQVVVVGDAKQMPPSAFFTSKSDTKTILDQAENSYTNIMLKWHYRSRHPDLIRFSNNEFYNSNLISLPPASAEKSIELIKVEGQYDKGRNILEANAIVDYLTAASHLTQKKVLVIAFSQEQEKTILNKYKEKGGQPNSDLVFRNLENAQGIEADYVLISVGYGKSSSGEFRLNFGPVNQVKGANRLNVLFTRAIEKMVVFTSVSSHDFGLSENKGVQLFKDFLSYAESMNVVTTAFGDMPLSHQIVAEILKSNHSDYNYYEAVNGLGIAAFVQHKNNKILLVDPLLGQNELTDLTSVLSALKNRFKEVKIVLSIDLWLHKKRLEKELKTYFL